MQRHPGHIQIMRQLRDAIQAFRKVVVVAVNKDHRFIAMDCQLPLQIGAESVILRRHVLRLISIPLVTVFGLEFASTLAFAVVTETIFSWPGIGKLIIDSIQSLDRPVMVAYLMLVAFVFIMINFLVDLTYFALDPRLRKGRG